MLLKRRGGPGPPRALLVAPDPALWSPVSTAVKARGFALLVRSSLESALAATPRRRHALILVDARLPGDGLASLCTKLKAHAGGEGAFVLVLVDGERPADLEEALRGAADDVFVRTEGDHWLAARLAIADQRIRELDSARSTHGHLRRLEKAVETMQLGVTVSDIEGRIVYANPADAAMHGYSLGELIGKPATIYGPSSTRRRLRPKQLQRVSRWRRETVNVRKDGTAFPVHLMSDLVVDEDGTPSGLVTTCEDISERKAAEEALRDSEERYALAARGANDALWDWDFGRDRMYLSPRWNEMLGGTGEEATGAPGLWLDRVHSDDRTTLRAALDEHLEGRTTHFSFEHRVRRNDGSYVWVLARGLAVHDGRSTPTRMAGSLTDVTARKLHDPLTRLPNRALMLDRLEQALERGKRAGRYRFAAVALELDRFAHVSQSYGPTAADRLVEAAAERLRTCLRGADTVSSAESPLAHIGAGRFTVLLHDIDEPRDAARIAGRLLDALREPFAIEGHEVFTSASIGIVAVGASYNRSDDVLRDAETAMAQARRSGGGTYVVFDDAMHAKAIATIKLENELRHAVERGELRVVYQPIVALASGELAGFEALVRWQHPDGMLLMPEQFIPLAEQTGLIVAIDRWVIGQACRQARQWMARGRRSNPLTVAVNVSGVQFRQPDFTVEIDRTLRSVGLYGRTLKLEITESVFMEQENFAAALLAQLRSLDIKLSVDDFGTGYSSLAYLYRFEIDTLKIDRSFVQRVPGDNDSREIVRAIVSLGQNLRKDIVAEGLETRSQLDLLRGLDCEYGQGFFFSVPLEVEMATSLVDRSANAPVFKL